MKGDTTYTSELANFRFYDLMWYWDRIEGERKLGIWLGVSHCVGSRLFYLIMTENSDIISRTTVQNIIEDNVTEEEI